MEPVKVFKELISTLSDIKPKAVICAEPDTVPDGTSVKYELVAAVKLSTSV